MSQLATKKYEISTLLPLNGNYDHHHTQTQDDADAVDCMVEHIELSHSEAQLKSGERLIYISGHGDYTARVLIEKYSDAKLTVCIDPYIPFAFHAPDGIKLDVCGGPFMGSESNRSMKACRELDQKYELEKITDKAKELSETYLSPFMDAWQ